MLLTKKSAANGVRISGGFYENGCDGAEQCDETNCTNQYPDGVSLASDDAEINSDTETGMELFFPFVIESSLEETSFLSLSVWAVVAAQDSRCRRRRQFDRDCSLARMNQQNDTPTHESPSAPRLRLGSRPTDAGTAFWVR